MDRSTYQIIVLVEIKLKRFATVLKMAYSNSTNQTIICIIDMKMHLMHITMVFSALSVSKEGI